MTVSVDAVVYFNVIDAEQALCSVDDFRSALESSPIHPSVSFSYCYLDTNIIDSPSLVDGEHIPMFSFYFRLQKRL